MANSTAMDESDDDFFSFIEETVAPAATEYCSKQSACPVPVERYHYNRVSLTVSSS